MVIFKPIFHLATLFARTDKKVGTLPTCSRRIFSPANFNQSLCRILVFASRRANKVAKWKIGFRYILSSQPCDLICFHILSADAFKSAEQRIQIKNEISDETKNSDLITP